MKRFSIGFLGIIFSVFMLTNVASAVEKFACVSIDRVAEAYSKAKEYMKALEDKEASYTTEFDKKREEVKQFQDKMNLLSDKEKEAKKAEFESKVNNLQDFIRQKQTDLRKEQVDKMMELSKDIKDTITKYAEKEGCTLVFDAAVIAYQTKNMDITDKIIEILNKNYKK